MNNGAAGHGSSDTRLERRIQELSDSVRKLEKRTSTVVGGWRLEEAPDGSLLAVHPMTGTTVVLAELPEEDH